jgi:hypothetical protein
MTLVRAEEVRQMGEFVVNGASIKCNQGIPGTGSLIVLPTARVTSGDMPVATVMDFKPMANIPSFGMCNSSQNPTTIAATSAASGVHTPGACVPLPLGPWSPGSSKTSVGNLPALTKDSKCNCTWGGSITIEMEGQQKASVG